MEMAVIANVIVVFHFTPCAILCYALAGQSSGWKGQESGKWCWQCCGSGVREVVLAVLWKRCQGSGVGSAVEAVSGKWCWQCCGSGVREVVLAVLWKRCQGSGVGSAVEAVSGKWCWQCCGSGVREVVLAVLWKRCQGSGVGSAVEAVSGKWCWQCCGSSTWRPQVIALAVRLQIFQSITGTLAGSISAQIRKG
ncbi:hypothetical protein ACOMHN_067617 [Nucella lapillus]